MICLNPELVKAPGSCIDYVVIRELCHLVHEHHRPAFYALLSRAIPDWKQRKRRLEREGAETDYPAAHPCGAQERYGAGAKR